LQTGSRRICDALAQALENLFSGAIHL